MIYNLRLFAIVFFALCFSSTFGQKNKDFQTLELLKEIAGEKTISGIHNREPNAIPDQWTNNIYKLTGK